MSSLAVLLNKYLHCMDVLELSLLNLHLSFMAATRVNGSRQSMFVTTRSVIRGAAADEHKMRNWLIFDHSKRVIYGCFRHCPSTWMHLLSGWCICWVIEIELNCPLLVLKYEVNNEKFTTMSHALYLSMISSFRRTFPLSCKVQVDSVSYCFCWKRAETRFRPKQI